MRALLFGTTLGMTLALAACVEGSGQRPTSKNATASGKQEPKMICREEAATGSLFTHTVCRSPEQVEDERAAGQDLARRQRGTSSPDQQMPSLQPPTGGPR
jgi:hypothetical protein